MFTAEDRKLSYNPFQALRLLRVHSFTSFVETVDVCVQLGVNPKNGEQIVRGTAFMPSGLGRTTRVAVLCSETLREELTKVGADQFIGAAEMEAIANGRTEFDVLLTTPELLPSLKAFGRVLGPRGLMPNPKMGTLVAERELGGAVQRAKAGQVSFRVDAGANIHASLGKADFSDEQLLRNFKSLINALQDKRPPSLKGRYFITAFVKTTMGPRWKLNIDEIDPRHRKCIWPLIES
jgi:large subunit ribosomal protein L1